MPKSQMRLVKLSEEAMARILCVGMATIDLLSVIDDYPMENTEAAIRKSAVAVGGPVGRGAICCARLGANTQVTAMIGKGVFSDILRSESAKEFIDMKFVVDQESEASQHSLILISNYGKYRTIFWTPQPRANAELLQMSTGLMKEADVVLTDCTDRILSLSVARAARESNVPCIMDTGSYKPYVEEILPYLDHIVAPEKFFATRAQLFGSEPDFQMHSLLDKFQPKSVVMTKGEHGGIFLFPGMDNIGCYPALDVRSIDTCGAGDAFHAAFAYGISQKWSLHDVTWFSSWVAGRKCAGIGNETLPREGDIAHWRQEIEAVAAR
jgi:sugar/nucleoside kinase (ribokinase family)